jgi:hypothetical protein
VKQGFNKSSICKKTSRRGAESTRFNWKEMAMRSVLFALIMLLASTAVLQASQAQSQRYAQALNRHQQAMQVRQDQLNGVDQGSDRDALTRRIEQDSKRLDRLIEICGGC